MKGRIFYYIGGAIVFIYGIIRLVRAFTPDPINDDLIDYVNKHLIPAEKLKMQAIDAYNNVAGAHYTSDARMTDSLKTIVIPNYTQFDDILKSLRPATKEVSNLNTRYMAIADTELSGFTVILSGLESEDSLVVAEGSRKIQKADAEMTQWDATLDSLAEKHDVEITKKRTK